MIKAGDELIHRRSGSRIKFTYTAEETDGQFLQAELWIKPNALVLPAHIHGNQSEMFEVLSGTAVYQLDGDYHRLDPGEKVVFHPGQAHVNPVSARSGDLHLRMTIEPAFDFHLVLEAVFKTAIEEGALSNSLLYPLHYAVLMNKLHSQIYWSKTPIWLQKLMLPLLAFIGKLLGYKSDQQ